MRVLSPRRIVSLLVAGVLLVAGGGAADAQTRLSLTGGGLVPFGDLADASDPSMSFGLRAEFQPVNALGQRRLLSLCVSGTYSTLDAASEVAAMPSGGGGDAYLLEVDAGVRAYSRVAPFFVAGGGGYARFRAPGSASDLDGVHVHAGLGFLAPLSVATVEVEGRLSQVFAESDGSLQYLTVLLGLGMPF